MCTHGLRRDVRDGGRAARAPPLDVLEETARLKRRPWRFVSPPHAPGLRRVLLHGEDAPRAHEGARAPPAARGRDAAQRPVPAQVRADRRAVDRALPRGAGPGLGGALGGLGEDGGVGPLARARSRRPRACAARSARRRSSRRRTCSATCASATPSARESARATTRARATRARARASRDRALSAPDPRGGRSRAPAIRS